jgi:hypothetical protein
MHAGGAGGRRHPWLLQLAPLNLSLRWLLLASSGPFVDIVRTL